MSEYIRYFRETDTKFKQNGLNPHGYSIYNWNSPATQAEREYFRQKLMYRIYGTII